MKTETINNKTEFHKKIINELSNKGIQVISPEDIAFLYENDNNDIIVDYKYMSTGIHYSKKEISEQEVLDAGFKWYGTWNYYE